jgi:eukaryotic-like serine/threonine-protein kinase
LPASFADGRYVVKSFLGEGSRKRVYLAHDERLDRDVAFAIIKTEGLDADGLTRVRREAQAMARLGDHPHIVTVFDIGEETGPSGQPQPYIVSQYMAGGELADIMRNAEDGRLSVAEAVRIADQVRMALEYAHARRIIHRDLKPANIWMTEDGTAKLGDFGLAVALDRSRLTMEGMMVGTVAYMPPEQALGRQPDARSDLYSLGCVLYEMLTGRPPFLGDDSVSIISQHINTAPVAPSWHNPQIPRALEALIMRLLAKNPDERPTDASVLPAAMAAINRSAAAAGERSSQEAEPNPLDRLAGGVFVGREKEMDELRAGLEDALSGRGRLLMLVGEPGIGKTRTSEELATYAGLRNVQVVWGRCYEGEGAPAYWPWVQAIRSYVHDRDPQELASEMGPGAADIAQVVPEVKERLPGLPAPPALEPEQARFRLFDSITTFLKNASLKKPMMLILDDLHWGDKPSLLLLQFLTRELRGSRLLVLGTYRDVELGRAHPLAQTLGELGREGLSHRILLRGLTEQDVARFIEITSGAKPPAALVEAVYRETEGNPFFVNEIVRLLVTDGRLEKADTVTSWSVTIPQSVREVVGRRLDHLSEPCNRVLTIGAVIGREFDVATLERVEEVSGDRLLEALEEAVAARVIAEVPRSADHYSFSHALIRETLYEELGTVRRVRLHRQIGETLEEMHSASIDAHLPQLAYHFFEAAQGGDVDKAVVYAKRAGERAVALYAWEDAANQFEHGLQALDLQTPVDGGRKCDLLLAMGDARFGAGDVQESKSAFRRAADVAKELKDGERLALAALGYGRHRDVGLVQEDVVAILREALDGLPAQDSALRARLLGRLGQEMYYASLEEWDALTREAIEGARRIGDKTALSDALFSRWRGGSVLGETEERLAGSNEIIRLAEETGDRQGLAAGLFVRIRALMIIGDVKPAYEDVETYARLAGELRIPFYLWQAELLRGMRALFEGRLEEADRLAQTALAVGQRGQGNNAMQMFGVQTFAIRREQGRLAGQEAGSKRFMQLYPAVPAWRTGLAFNYAERGMEEEARSEFEILAKDDFSIFPRDGDWPISMALLAQVCAFLGDEQRAAYLYDELAPFEHRCIIVGANVDCYGTVDRLLGLLAATMKRWDDAERHFADALEMNTRMGSGRWTGWTQHEYANMLLKRAGAGDREKALGLLNQAIDIAQPLGMKALLERSLALKLKAQGIDGSDPQTSIDTVARVVQQEQPDLREHAAPDGTVTIMFSDIEGSTQLTERLGDKAWMALLREHNAIVREQVKAHGGFEVKSAGDGFMVAFQSARKGLDCAIGIQKALAERNTTAAEPVMVRMGLHAGEVIKEGEDFFGKNVILAARVASQAKGGEILVSGLLKALVESAGDLPWGEPRTVELKGLSGAHEIWPVTWSS